MTRLIFAAGVAALAITAPASAKPDRRGGADDRAQVVQQQDRKRSQRPERAQARSVALQRVERNAPRIERRQNVTALQRREERSVERVKPQRTERVRTRATARQEVRTNRVEQARTRVAERQQVRSNRVERVQERMADRQNLRANRVERPQNRVANRQELGANRVERVQNRVTNRQELREQAQNRLANRQELRADRLKDRIAARTALRNERLDPVRAFRPLPARLMTERTRIRPFGETVRFIGEPVRNVSRVVTLAALPSTVSYLYPDSSDFYYRYGDGYVYRIDRQDDVIDWLLPLMAGGFMPGQYLPNYYRSSFVPSYYGLNSFYPDYGNDCYRYGYGVVYETDCFTGLVENVIPLYAGGYGVGQLLPSSYSYYNVPYQYRSMYYPTADYSYWYAPGAIYQYDTRSSLITSVAALMAPGFTIGQPLPMGYNMYNVPYAYRSTYYDTPNAWYRYNNGYIYQVDPATLLVTAAVASILT